MGGFHAAPAPYPGPYYGPSVHPTEDTAPPEYPRMKTLPDGSDLERVTGRFYIHKERKRWWAAPTWRVYELCEDLAFRSYPVRYRSEHDARMTADAMFWMALRYTKSAYP